VRFQTREASSGWQLVQATKEIGSIAANEVGSSPTIFPNEISFSRSAA
jgi:hypothetical protein